MNACIWLTMPPPPPPHHEAGKELHLLDRKEIAYVTRYEKTDHIAKKTKSRKARQSKNR